MPIYEFACGNCGATFEKLCRLSDAAAPACPKCGSSETTKKFSECVARSGGSGAKGGESSGPPPGSKFT